MAHGKSLALRQMDIMNRWRRPRDRETKPRDRSLNGKQRVKARKDANKTTE